MELPVVGKTVADKFQFAQSMLGQQAPVTGSFQIGEILDISAVTKGKGLQGPVRRWGIAIQKRKHARTGKMRHVGNLGPWHPSHISWRVPQLGQIGYHQRTEFNKRLMALGTDGSDVTPDGGFPEYGIVRSSYALIKGSLPGPAKRLIRMRKALRPGQIEVKGTAVPLCEQRNPSRGCAEMKANILDLTGKQVGQIDLPAVFDEEYRPDLIKEGSALSTGQQAPALRTSLLRWHEHLCQVLGDRDTESQGFQGS